MNSAEIQWFVYPADTSRICSGVLQPTHGTGGIVRFDQAFVTPPRRILVALNKLEMDKSSNCRFNIVHESVSEAGMIVRVET